MKRIKSAKGNNIRIAQTLQIQEGFYTISTYKYKKEVDIMAKKEACCGCNCHGVKHWVTVLSLVLLGAVGLWWSENFMMVLSALLLLHGLIMAGDKLCRCC